MTKREHPPSHGVILNYWFNSPDAETLLGWECFDNIAECSLGHWFCWSCGIKVSGPKRLEKCHIIPHALGGSNKEDNYFLMCPACHAESPDTDKPSIFYKWIRNKLSYSEQYLSDIHKVLSSYDIPEDYLTTVVEDVTDSTVSLCSHGGRVTRSSILGILDYHCEKNCVED